MQFWRMAVKSGHGATTVMLRPIRADDDEYEDAPFDACGFSFHLFLSFCLIDRRTKLST